MANRYVGLLMNSRTQAHAFHLTTSSFAEHKALQAYYEGIVPLLDAWAEAYMGKYGRLRRVSLNKRFIKDPTKARAYFKSLLSRVKAIRLPRGDSYLKNIQDEITALIRSTLYMLTLK
ncbi:hypothetical protein EBT25_12830 [bacterium]|jgi:hypothetical protein|nr:hypothetical protein [bacterium]